MLYSQYLCAAAGYDHDLSAEARNCQQRVHIFSSTLRGTAVARRCFQEAPQADTLQLICDPVGIEVYLSSHHVQGEAAARLAELSDVMRMLEKGVFQGQAFQDHVHDLLADIEVAVEHLDHTYDEDGFYHIEKLQHATWWAFVCSCRFFGGFNPFEHFQHSILQEVE